MFSVRNRCILNVIFVSTITILLVLYTGVSSSMSRMEVIRPENNSAILDETIDFDDTPGALDVDVCSKSTEFMTTWKTRQTSFLRGVPGFMMFENVYLFEGVLLAITSNKSSIPPTSKIMSGPEENHVFNPAGSDRWRVLDLEEADGYLGRQRAGVLSGVTFLFNDGPGAKGFLAHYFHFVAEAFAGAWRVLTSSPSNLMENTAMDTPFPSRFIMARGTDWRDRAGLNAWFIDTIFPSTAYEDNLQWEDRARSGGIYMFEEVLIIDRRTAHRVQGSEAQIWNKMSADVFATDAPLDWFEPLRRSLMGRLGIEEGRSKRKVITYIDRQATGRLLRKEDHEALVTALERFQKEHDVEVNMVQMENLPKSRQFEISTRTDILIGVHGNGLSHMLWMKPAGKVLEFLNPGNFIRDYELLAEAMRHDHYVIWNDTVHTTWRQERKHAVPTSPVRLHAPFVMELLTTLIQ